jgi:FkbM family methyltransferase
MRNLSSLLLAFRESPKSWRLQQFLYTKNISIRPSSSTLDGQLIQLLEKHEIENCIDVGAHVGSFVQKMLRLGFKGNIFCIEPSLRASKELRIKLDKVKNIEIFELALGRDNSNGQLHNSGSPFASLLEASKLGKAYMESGNAQDQPIAIMTLDEFLKDKKSIKLNKTFLKIDVQGFEKNVLLGGQFSLLEIPVVLVECVLNSLYEESSDVIQIIELMKEKGFMVAAIHSDNWFNGFAPDCDVIFTRV